MSESNETLNPLGGRWVAADGTPTEPTYATDKDRHIADLEIENQALDGGVAELNRYIDELVDDLAQRGTEVQRLQESLDIAEHLYKLARAERQVLARRNNALKLALHTAQQDLQRLASPTRFHHGGWDQEHRHRLQFATAANVQAMAALRAPQQPMSEESGERWGKRATAESCGMPTLRPRLAGPSTPGTTCISFARSHEATTGCTVAVPSSNTAPNGPPPHPRVKRVENERGVRESEGAARRLGRPVAHMARAHDRRGEADCVQCGGPPR